MKTSRCKSCGAEVVWALTPAGKKTPIDAKPMRVAVLVEDPETGEEITRYGLVVIESGVVGHTSHWSTCPNAAQHRKSGARRTTA